VDGHCAPQKSSANHVTTAFNVGFILPVFVSHRRKDPIAFRNEQRTLVENADTQVNGLAIPGHFDAQPKSARGARIIASSDPSRRRHC